MQSSAENHRSYAARRNWLLTVCVDLLLVVSVVAFIGFYHLDSPSIHYRDETTHVRAIQEMRESGSWWRPTVRGNLYLNKPPFKMWLTSVPLALFGESAFSYRFLDALAGVLTCTMLYFFGRALFASRIAGLFAAIGMISCEAYVFDHGIRKAVQDSMLIFLSTAALILGWRALEMFVVNSRRARRLAAGAGICIGLGVLTKSAGGMLPLVIAAVYLVVSRRLLPTMRRERGLIAALLVPAFGIPALWYLPHFLFTPGATQIVLGQEIVKRATVGYHNSDDFYFYFKALVFDRVALGPELLIPSLLWAVVAFSRERIEHLRFLLVWAFVPVVLFSFFPSRLTWYISPAFPAMALILGGAVAAAFQGARRQFSLWWQDLAGYNAVSALQTGFVVLALCSIGYQLDSITRQLFVLRPRHSFDFLVQDIVDYNTEHGGAGRIISLNAPPSALHESTYDGMIAALIQPASSVEETLKLLDGKQHGFVFADIESALALFSARMPVAYRYYAPLHDRGRWLVIASYLDGFSGTQLSRSNRLVNFGNAPVSALYGLGPPIVHGEVGLQRIVGGAAAILIEGDSLVERLGTSMALNVMSLSNEPIKLEMFLNERSVYSVTLTRSNLQTLRFGIGSGVWRKGKNTFTFTLSRRDGTPLEDDESPIQLNWLTVELGMNR